MDGTMGHLAARKVQLNFTISPDLFVRLDNFIDNNNYGSRSGVLSLLITMLVSNEEDAKMLARHLKPEQLGVVKHIGESVAVVLREGNRG
jgi:metal-responsive CopG/Arc/MetJ family transcriptional regulator